MVTSSSITGWRATRSVCDFRFFRKHRTQRGERHTLPDGDSLANHGRLPDNNTCAMSDGEACANSRRGMNFATRARMRNLS